MAQKTRGASIMFGKNEQAYFRSRNTNGRNISRMHTHRRFGSAKKVTELDPKITGSNEDDTKTDTCCIVNCFIPIVYTNRWADVYPYSEAYGPIENVPIVSGDTAYNNMDGNTYILVFHDYLYYVTDEIQIH